jgi:large subunit ribosomal protein L25
MDEISLNATIRQKSGKGVAHRLRAAGSIPGVFYLGGEVNQPIELSAHELQLALKKKPKLLLLKLNDGSRHECVVRELQMDPVTGKYLHVDLLGIVRGKKMTVKVKVELQGNPIGVRVQGGVLQQSVHSVNIECLPKDIPENITIDISELKVGSSVHVRDLPQEAYRILDDPDVTIATVLAPRIEKVVEAAPEEAAPEEAGEAEEEEKQS